MMSFRYSADRKLCAVAYLLLIYALKNENHFRELPEFGYQANGKPFLKNYPGLHFNLAHCHSAIACVLGEEEAGVDIEDVLEYDDDLARAVCNPEEYTWVNLPGDRSIKGNRLTELWTRKESVLKWMGSGLSKDPREIGCLAPTGIPDLGFQTHTLSFEKERIILSICK